MPSTNLLRNCVQRETCVLKLSSQKKIVFKEKIVFWNCVQREICVQKLSSKKKIVFNEKSVFKGKIVFKEKNCVLKLFSKQVFRPAVCSTCLTKFSKKIVLKHNMFDVCFLKCCSHANMHGS